MKRSVPLMLVSFCFFLKVAAQCDLNAVITPNDLILCPNTTDTLFATKGFDSYQWLKFNKVIPGATKSYLIVSSVDAGSFYKVVVTKNTCTDTSKKVLVDGYVFVLPTIETTGTPSYIDPNTGTPAFCKSEMVTVTLNAPYTENVQWYDSGKAIAGATNSTYTVTKTGSYTACGNTDICPTYRDCESIPVDIVIDKYTASVTRSGDTLIASAGKAYQWFKNNAPIAGATKMYYVPLTSGLYSVGVIDKLNCNSKSKLVAFTLPSTLLSITPNPAYSFIVVNINKSNAARIIIADMYGNNFIQENVQSNNQRIMVDKLKSGIYSLHITDKNGIMIATEKFVKN